ncbi:MAG TPA: disulfide bond formation protein DsbA [Deltaproteobacteria bacterium]|nr:disulfide bond formation protein DsbA [Deltaproteobacteria bacterium]
MKKAQIFILSGLALLMLFIAGSVFYKGKETKKIESVATENTAVFAREYSQTLGSEDAKVTITEFLDPGCETCRTFHPFIKEMLAHYAGKVKLVVRYIPLHHGADEMVKILEASKEQGKYWETLEVMYESQPSWASHSNPQPEQIWKFLSQVGLNIEKLKKDMHLPEIEKNLAQDIADAQVLNVKKTPQFFVNGRPLVIFGSQQLVDLVQSEVEKHYSK